MYIYKPGCKKQRIITVLWLRKHVLWWLCTCQNTVRLQPKTFYIFQSTFFYIHLCCCSLFSEQINNFNIQVARNYNRQSSRSWRHYAAIAGLQLYCALCIHWVVQLKRQRFWLVFGMSPVRILPGIPVILITFYVVFLSPSRLMSGHYLGQDRFIPDYELESIDILREEKRTTPLNKDNIKKNLHNRVPILRGSVSSLPICYS